MDFPAFLDPLTDCLCNGLEDLVMPPPTPGINEALGAAAQDVFSVLEHGADAGACGWRTGWMG